MFGIWFLGIALGDLDNDNWPGVNCWTRGTIPEKDHSSLKSRDGTFKEVILKTTSPYFPIFPCGNDMRTFNNDGLFDFISLDMMSWTFKFDIKTSTRAPLKFPLRFYKNNVDLGLKHHQLICIIALQKLNQWNPLVHCHDFQTFAQLFRRVSSHPGNWSWGSFYFLIMDNDV